MKGFLGGWYGFGVEFSIRYGLRYVVVGLLWLVWYGWVGMGWVSMLLVMIFGDVFTDTNMVHCHFSPPFWEYVFSFFQPPSANSSMDWCGLVWVGGKACWKVYPADCHCQ